MLEGFLDATYLITGRPGVYALYMDDELLYIGQSSNVPIRIAAHKKSKRRNRIIFNRVLVRWCEVWEMERVEYNLISELKPKYNIAGIDYGPTPIKRVNLARLGLRVPRPSWRRAFPQA